VADSNSLKDEILSLISRGDIALAEAKTHALLSEYSHDDNLPQFLIILAQGYNWANSLEQAGESYQYVIDNFTDSNTVEQARFGIKVVDILSKIKQGTDSGALIHVSELIADFSQVAELPEYAFRISQYYEGQGNYQQAQLGYLKVSQSFPDSDYAERALLDSCRISIWLDILSDKMADASGKFIALVKDHSSSDSLADVLYYLGQLCRWHGNYDFAEVVLSAVIDLTTDSSLKSDAQLSYHGARALENVHRGRFSQAQEEMDIILSNYKDNKDFAGVCYALADRLRWRGKAVEMKVLYDAILRNCPDSKEALSVTDQMDFYNVLALIDADNIPAAETAMTALYSKEVSLEELNKMRFFIAEQFYYEGLQLRDGGNRDAANLYYGKAVEKWEQLLSISPDFTLGPKTRIWPADCYHNLKNYEKSIENFKNDIETYPDQPNRWYALFMIADSYKHMAKQGQISSDLADSKSQAIYNEIASSYPDCPAINAVNKELNK